MTDGFFGALSTLARLGRSSSLAPIFYAARAAADAVCLAADRPPLGVRLDDMEVRGYLRHRAFLADVASGLYEPFLRDLFLEALRPGVLVIDGGAHLGLYSLLAARTSKPSRILAFEPSQYNFRALMHNVRSNRVKNVMPHKKALSDRAGTADFYDSSGTISSSLIRRTGLDRLTRDRVTTIALDEAIGDVPAPGIVAKLDIEGAEPLALRGMRRILRSASYACVICEVNPRALRDGGMSPAILLYELAQLGFRTSFVDRSMREPIPVSDPAALPKGNLYCIKP